MYPLGILTDASAYFPDPYFPGRELVVQVPLTILNQPPDILEETLASILHAQLQRFQHLLLIFHASALSPLPQVARQCIQRDHLEARVILVDSGSFSLGLGLLVQQAASHARNAPENYEEIARHLRHYRQNIYTLVTVPDFNIFLRQKLLSPAQVTIARMLHFTPIYSLERGDLTLIDKIRTNRHLLHTYEEFLSEFERLDYIGYVHTGKVASNIINPLRAHIHERFPDLKIHLCPLRPVVPSIIPANMQGMIVGEHPL